MKEEGRRERKEEGIKRSRKYTVMFTAGRGRKRTSRKRREERKNSNKRRKRRMKKDDDNNKKKISK